MPPISSFVTHLARPFPCVRINAPREIWRGSARETPTCNSLRMASDFTPAPNASQATYRFIDESVEPFEEYTAGGYYPLQIGHRLGPLQRYHIVHKLGHGGSSTIWLALDELMARYVAVKIAVSDLDRPFESSILKSLWSDKESTCNTRAGIATIPAILDEFEVEGPEIEGSRRKHHCLVTTLARMSLAEAREVSNRRSFQPLVAHAIAAQLVQAVAFLHSQEIVHADLHEGNILLQLPSSINNLQPDQLYKKYGQPELEQVKRSDGKPLDSWVPTHGVIPIWFGYDEPLSLADSRIFLNNFGESSRPAVEARPTHTPLIYRSPEMLVDPKSPVSFPAEICSLASAIFAIMGQRPLFESWFPEEDEILAEYVDTLGRFPEEWWAGWANRKNHFDDQLQTPHGQPRRSLEERLEYSVQKPRRETGMAEMNEEEKEDFLLLLRSMLSFKPEERICAQQVLESSWVQKWTKPALESLENTPHT